MTPGIIGIAETDTVWDALRMLVGHRISALVVFDAARTPVGVLSEGDLMRRAELGSERRRPVWLEFLLGDGHASRDYVEAHGDRVGELMHRGIVSIEADCELPEAIDMMLARRVRRLVIMDKGEAVGVLARSDLLRPLLSAAPAPAPPCSDDELRARVEAAIVREPWTPARAVRVEVADGVVTLLGAIADDRLRDGLKVLCETVPGVKSVRDRIAWVEPSSGYLVPVPDASEG
jgi:CBS domain-containing protein